MGRPSSCFLISPLIDTYLVPEAPQSRVAHEYRLVKNKNKNNTIRTDEPTPGTLALIEEEEEEEEYDTHGQAYSGHPGAIW